MKIIFYPAISLDGFIANSDGDSNWVSDEDEQLFVQEVQKAGCVIVGNKTFDQYKGAIYPISGATTFVCTRQAKRLEETTDTDVQYIKGDITEIVNQVQAAGFENAILSGGADLNNQFIQAQLIQEMIVSIYPITLGTGLPIFGKLDIQLKFELLDTKKLGSGVIQNRYKVLYD